MQVSFEPLSLASQTEALVSFLTSESWPFHSHSKLSRDQVLSFIAKGFYDGSNHQTFWIVNVEGERIGLIRLFDLDDIGDGYPLFDLRLRASVRGQGIGRRAVQWLTEYLFETWPVLDRIEATTRQDNLAMRKALLRSHYAKEGHYRKAWEGHDTIQYAILREDWLNESVTPVNWDDEPVLG